jgi:hypothetical protein
MPTYSFKNKETDEQFDLILKISQLDEFKTDHPHLQQVISTAQPTVRSRDQKPDGGFRDVLKSIKKASGRGNTINTF